MAERDNRRGREAVIAGRDDAPYKILIFHGYSGSPGEFEELPEVLAQELDARVYMPLMPGHGTKVEDLLPISYKDLVAAAEKEAAAFLDDRPFVIGGNSFGSYLAAHTASRRDPRALFLAATPFHLRMPFSLPGARFIARMKPKWKKYIVENERRARTREFFYDHMPGKGLSLALKGNARMPDLLSRITCPILTMHEKWDPLSHPEGSAALASLAHGAVRQTEYFDEGWHGLFYGDVRHASFETVKTFLKKTLHPQ